MAGSPDGKIVYFKYYDYDTTTLLFETTGDSGNISTSEIIRAEICPTPSIEGREFIQWDLFSINDQSYLNSGVSFKAGQAYPIEITSNINYGDDSIVKATARWKVPVNDYIILDCGDASEWIPDEITFYIDGKIYFALPKMSWYNFVNSEYNIDNFYISNIDSSICDSFGHNILGGGRGVYSEDVIRDNEVYSISDVAEPEV